MQPMPMYPPAPPRPRRFPFFLTAFLLGFVTLCVLAVIGAGAAALVVVRAAGAPQAAPSQTGELFLLHMAAGRYADASRLVDPAYSGSVAGLGETHKAVWGENRGCSRMSCRSGIEGDGCGFRLEQKATMEYDVKGTDGAMRKVRMRVVNGQIEGLSVDGQVLVGGPGGGEGMTVSPAPVSVPGTKTAPVETEAPAAGQRPGK